MLGVEAPPILSVARAPRVAGGVALAIVAFAYRYLSFTQFSNDHFVHLSRAQQWLMGEWPVRDFVDPGMPLMYALSAVAQAISPGLHTELVLMSAIFAVATVLVYVASLQVGAPALVAAAAAIVSLIAHPVSYSYPKLLPYVAAICAVAAYAARPSRWRIAVLSVVTAAAFLFRHDHGILIAAGVVTALAVEARSIVPVRALAWFVGGTVLLLSPYLLAVQIWQGLPTYLRDGIAFSSREASKAVYAPPAFAIDRGQPLRVYSEEASHGAEIHVRWQPGLSDDLRAIGERRHKLVAGESVGGDTWTYEMRDWSKARTEALVKDPVVADTDGIDRKHYVVRSAPHGLSYLIARMPRPGPGLRLSENSISLLFYIVWMLPVAALAFAGVRWRELPHAVAPALAAAAVMQVLMNFTMLRDPLATRIRDVVAPAAVLVAFVAASLWRMSPRVWRLVTVAILIVMAAATGLVGSVGEKVRDAGFPRGLDGIRTRLGELRAELAPPDDRIGHVAAQYRVAVAYLERCTPVGSRLFGMAFVPELFFNTGRGFAGGHVLFTPGYYLTDRHASEILGRLAREDVPFVVVDNQTWPEMRQQYPRVVAHVMSRYREEARFTVAVGRDLMVLADTTRPVASRFGEHAWPCFVP